MATTEPRSLPGVGLTGYWPEGADGWKAGMDLNLLYMSALAGTAIVESIFAALPGSPADGYITIVPASDATNPGKMAIRDAGVWKFITLPAGSRVRVKDMNNWAILTFAGWVVEYAACSVNRGGTAQVIATNSPVNFEASAILRSDIGMWDAANPTRLTVPNGYSRARLSAMIEFNGSTDAGGERTLVISKNGTAVPGSGATRIYMPLVQNPWLIDLQANSAIMSVNGGDYFQLAIVVGIVGGTATTVNADGTNSWLQLECWA